MNPNIRFKTLLLVGALCLPLVGHATCINHKVTQTEDDRTAQIPFGRVHLQDIGMQPVGTLLASAIVPPTHYTYGGAKPDSVLWTCDAHDLPNLYFLVSTNGDDRVGGYWETGALDGLDGVYATWFEHVGLMLTMSDVTLSRYWQRVPLKNYAVVGGKIQIRLQDIPPLEADLYRISQIPPTDGAPSNYCKGVGSGGMGAASPDGTPYACTQPNAYIQLVGPGLKHDNIGEDHALYYRFWWADNGFGYGMRQAAILSQSTSSCMLRNTPPPGLFPTFPAGPLFSVAGNRVNVPVENACGTTADSGQPATGLPVSPGAHPAPPSA